MVDQVNVTGESPWCYTSEQTGQSIKVFETGELDLRVFRVATAFQLKDGKLAIYRRHEDGPLSPYGEAPQDPRIAEIGAIINAFPTIRELKVGVHDISVAVRTKHAWQGAQGYVVDTLFQVLSKESAAAKPAAVAEAATQPAVRASTGHPRAEAVSDADMAGVDGAVE